MCLVGGILTEDNRCRVGTTYGQFRKAFRVWPKWVSGIAGGGEGKWFSGSLSSTEHHSPCWQAREPSPYISPPIPLTTPPRSSLLLALLSSLQLAFSFCSFCLFSSGLRRSQLSTTNLIQTLPSPTDQSPPDHLPLTTRPPSTHHAMKKRLHTAKGRRQWQNRSGSRDQEKHPQRPNHAPS